VATLDAVEFGRSGIAAEVAGFVPEPEMLVRIAPVQGRQAVDPIHAPALVFDLDDGHGSLASSLAGKHDRVTLDGGHGLTHLCSVARQLSITPARSRSAGATRVEEASRTGRYPPPGTT
jgi:hypothetical protein